LPAPKTNVIKSKIITKIFQNYLKNKDIRIYKKKFIYYLIFRIIRKILASSIIIEIYKFKISCSTNKNSNSYYLLKKCEFGDYEEINTLSRFSNNHKILLIDCGCNYGFYTFYTASLSKNNRVISIEASNKTTLEFLKNYNLNKLQNISFHNKAISDKDDLDVVFNESENDWESSLTHKNFRLKEEKNIKTCKIDTLLKGYNCEEFLMFIKLDIEGNEIKALKGANLTINKFAPIIIIEFSKFMFDNNENINFFKNFIIEKNYNIYDTNKKQTSLEDIILNLNQLDDNHMTIGNYFLIKDSSKHLELFKKNG